MIGVITGDIINSRAIPPEKWLSRLKQFLGTIGSSPQDWEIYRGDSFQLEIPDPSDALLKAIQIKATIKSIRSLDARMAIGLGEKNYKADRINESNGEAFIKSGEGFESLKSSKQTLAVFSADETFNEEMNLYLRLVLIAMDNWTPGSAEIVALTLANQNKSQSEIGKLLGITQSSVSERQGRSYLSEIMEVEQVFREKLINLTNTS